MVSAHESVTEIAEIEAPWNKQVKVEEVVYEGGFPMVRLRIRERKRFTDLELDADTARTLVESLQSWLAKA